MSVTALLAASSSSHTVQQPLQYFQSTDHAMQWHTQGQQQEAAGEILKE